MRALQKIVTALRRSSKDYLKTRKKKLGKKKKWDMHDLGFT